MELNETQANGICLNCFNWAKGRRRITCQTGLLQDINREKCREYKPSKAPAKADKELRR